MLKSPLFFLVLILLMAVGCKDEDASPIVTQEKLLFGAFPRLIELQTTEFDLNNRQASSYDMEIDFVDNAAGGDIAEYRVFIAFDDNSTGDGKPDLSTDRELFRTYTPADFRAGPNSNLGVDVSISFSEAAAFTSVPLDSVEAGDRFQVFTEVEKTDGRVFSTSNSTPAITNAFNGIFDFNINATCPLSEGTFMGEYKVTYGEVYNELTFSERKVQALGTPPLNLTVTLTPVAGSSTRRTFKVGKTYLQPGFEFDPGTLTLDFVCDQITASDIDAGTACTTGTIEARQPAADPFDFGDDSSFTVTYIDFADDGGCDGLTPSKFTLVFTKQ